MASFAHHRRSAARHGLQRSRFGRGGHRGKIILTPQTILLRGVAVKVTWPASREFAPARRRIWRSAYMCRRAAGAVGGQLSPRARPRNI